MRRVLTGTFFILFVLMGTSVNAGGILPESRFVSENEFNLPIEKDDARINKKQPFKILAKNRIAELRQVFSNTVIKSYSGRNGLSRASSKNLINPVIGQRKLTIVNTPGHEHTGGFFGPHVRGKKHLGIDLMAKPGTPIRAAQTGKVHFTGVDRRGYGLYIVLRHKDTNGKIYETRYAHLSKINVKVGDIVSQGKVMALSGKTGNAKRAWVLPHLHFEYREVINNVAKAYNPLPHLVKSVPSHLKSYFAKNGLVALN